MKKMALFLSFLCLSLLGNSRLIALEDKSIELITDQTKMPDELSAEETKLIEFTNAERKLINLPPLQSKTELMKLARDHAETMAKLDKIGHELEGVTFLTRLEKSGLKNSKAGENLAQGQETPMEAVKDWMNSPGHKANILDPQYTLIGVGQAKSKTGSIYWTQVFAAP